MGIDNQTGFEGVGVGVAPC